jgi:hypothetical protein
MPTLNLTWIADIHCHRIFISISEIMNLRALLWEAQGVRSIGFLSKLVSKFNLLSALPK